MADISKCNDIHCPSKKKCYRFTAPAGLYQTYSNFNRESDADNCEYFLRLDIKFNPTTKEHWIYKRFLDEIEVTFEDVTTD